MQIDSNTKAIIDFAESHLGVGKVSGVQHVQSLWSGQGEIVRLLIDNNSPGSVIVKSIRLNNQATHPLGWKSELAFDRKKRSYEVEAHWYTCYSQQCHSLCRVPGLYRALSAGEKQYMLLEDLSIDFPCIENTLTSSGLLPALSWLANFHASFMQHDAAGLWPIGGYWHLQTRLQEYDNMQDGKLKRAAGWLDSQLSSCHYKTLIHGDAKLANAMFSSTREEVAMVDFQYTGRGCGVKDLVILLASSLTENERQHHDKELLDYYFHTLSTALNRTVHSSCVPAIESEWRSLYAIAWADYHRFLAGWMPEHVRIDDYMKKQTQIALAWAGIN